MRKTQRTYSAKPGEVESRWHVIDAEGMVLGRLATDIAKILQGKHKPAFTPHAITGDFIIVVNAAKLGVTGKKLHQKRYYRHSQYPGGLRELQLREMLQRHPERVLHEAVRRMLPNNRLRPILLRRLKVYAGPDHPHRAQVGISRKRATELGEQPPATRSTMREVRS